MRPPTLIVHCDWSISARKRWISAARLVDGRYCLSQPRNVAADILPTLVGASSGECVLAGFDFPIGLPWQYGQRTGLGNFRRAVAALGREGPWVRWFEVAEQRADVSLHRPFYPMRPGATRQRHLLEG